MITFGIYRLPGPAARAARAHPRPRRVATVKAQSEKLALQVHALGYLSHPQFGGSDVRWRTRGSSGPYKQDDGQNREVPHREWELTIRLNNGARAFHDQHLVAWKDRA